MKIYIAGKITGNTTYYTDFLKAKVNILEKYPNAVVISPAVLPRGLTHSEYMHICRAMIDVADTVVFLPNWQKSKGAKIEHEWAEKLNKKIIYLEDLK